MISTQNKLAHNKKKVVTPTEATPYVKQRQKGKPVWLSFEIVEALALEKKPGERSLSDVAERLLKPFMKEQGRYRPVDPNTMRFKK